MIVVPADTAAHLQKRAADRRAALEQRATLARARALTLAALLRTRFGAVDVYLHGSLARGGFDERSDIDLAVSGLLPAALNAAWLALDEQAAPFQLDLMDLDRLPARWQQTIRDLGERLP